MRPRRALVLLVLAGIAASADAAVLCAHKSRKTGTAAEGASLRLRTACKRTELAVDVVGTVGTDRLADGGVTAAKLASASVSDAAIGDGTISASKLRSGEVVTGRGALLASRLRLVDGSSADLFSLPALGTFKVTCLSGAGRTSFANGSGTDLNVQMSALDAGQPPLVSRANPPNGATVTFPNGGASGIESIEWQVSFTEAGGRAHVATAWITMGSAITDCIVTAHALVTS